MHSGAQGHWGMRIPFRIPIILGFFLLLFSAGVANAKSNSRIKGNITSVSGSPLRDAIIKIFREIHEGEVISIARSDSRGFFTSANLTPGTYYLQVLHQGYESVTTSKFIIDPERTVSLDIALREFMGYISRDDDPRNWDLKTVMRSTSDRRLIFRNSPGNGEMPGDQDGASQFHRSGAMSIASSTSLSGESFLPRPQASQNGVSSTFAYTEPVSLHSRMIFTGQLDLGYGSFWRVRDTYDYQPDGAHDYRVSVGYGRMNAYYPGSNSISSRIISEEPGMPESAVQMLALGLEGKTKFLDLLAVKYGFDYSRLHYGTAKSLFYPSIQILLSPVEGWSFKTSFTSRRINDANTVVLPDGEVLDLTEPTLITMIGDKVEMSQVRHSEVAAQRTLTPSTTVEVAVYQDHTEGPGLPLMITTITQLEKRSHVIEMNEDHSDQRGMRVTVRRKIWDRLKGSLAYAYGDAIDISDIEGPISSECLDGSLTDLLHQRAQHSITGRLNAILPITRTNVLATVRWYSGNPLTPVDWFSDRMDIGTKSTDFEIRQAVPLPDFFGTTGQWEIMVDLSNMLNQGKESLPATDGEIVLNRNPRSLRFGLNLSFR
jgi:hypothetical protein